MDERINLDALDTARGGELGFELKLIGPDGNELRGHLRVRGYDSATYQQKLDEQQRRRMTKLSTQKVPSVEELEVDTLELAAVLVMGWTCPFELEGKAFEYSAANAETLVKRFRWIRLQVDRAAGNRANFLPGPSAS